MTVEPWWKRWPARLDWEIEQLSAAGMRFQVHDPGSDGIVQIDVVHTIDDVEYPLEASFPHLYPYFRPVVRTDVRFDFHQEPFGGGLCLAARDPEHWNTEESLAHFIAEQLPLIVAANAPDEQRRVEVEEAVPEPVSENYRYAEPDFLLIDSAWSLPIDVDRGTLTIGVWQEELPLRGAVLRVQGPDGTELAAADARLAAQFGQHTLKVRWIRRPGPVLAHTAAEFTDALNAAAPEALARPRWIDFAGRRLDVLGIVYTDEVQYADYGDDWVFLLRRQQQTGARTAMAPSDPFLIRALRAGPTDLGRRVPHLAPLVDKKVTLAGLGALGAPAAMAFARAGIGSLSVIDHDFVDPGTSSRWPHGLLAAGNRKVNAVAAFVSPNWPYTKIEGAPWRLGDLAVGAEANDSAVLNSLLVDTDLIFDATANTAVNHALADIAWEAGLPYVVVSATEGAWGGLVARLESGRTGCWQCFNAALDGDIPLPPRDPSAAGRVAPVACSETTFTGAGFDLTPLADEAVRVATARLAEGAAAYPRAGWDVETLALRTPDGQLCPPTWTAYQLPTRPECPVCGAA